VADIITFMSKKWGINKRNINLRLCRSTADVIKMDLKKLEVFTINSRVSLAKLI